jgi:hypothetical protein
MKISYANVEYFVTSVSHVQPVVCNFHGHFGQAGVSSSTDVPPAPDYCNIQVCG